jgi:2-polyprenyl-6-methoxyphenol hydroxylase-like FAD-dependent oxidoreductase
MKARCCIVGGGPAGMMLGYLLGRAGVDVVVLEKQQIFSAIFAATPCIPRRCR